MIKKRTVTQNLSDLGDIYKPLTQEQCEKIHEFQNLLAALQAARWWTFECDCSKKELMSGHKNGCWYPVMQKAIAKAEMLNGTACQCCGVHLDFSLGDYDLLCYACEQKERMEQNNGKRI